MADIKTREWNGSYTKGKMDDVFITLSEVPGGSSFITHDDSRELKIEKNEAIAFLDGAIRTNSTHSVLDFAFDNMRDYPAGDRAWIRNLKSDMTDPVRNKFVNREFSGAVAIRGRDIYLFEHLDETIAELRKVLETFK